MSRPRHPNLPPELRFPRSSTRRSSRTTRAGATARPISWSSGRKRSSSPTRSRRARARLRRPVSSTTRRIQPPSYNPVLGAHVQSIVPVIGSTPAYDAAHVIQSPTSNYGPCNLVVTSQAGRCGSSPWSRWARRRPSTIRRRLRRAGSESRWITKTRRKASFSRRSSRR